MRTSAIVVMNLLLSLVACANALAKDDTLPSPRCAAGKPPGPHASERGRTNDVGVRLPRTLQSNDGNPTPTAIPVGRILSTRALENEMYEGTDFLLVDVEETPHPCTITKARSIPFAGRPGSFADQVQQRLSNELAVLTKNRPNWPNYPIVFFCQDEWCWESYNAVLRAYEAGYRNVYWYRDGLAAWMAADLPTQPW